MFYCTQLPGKKELLLQIPCPAVLLVICSLFSGIFLVQRSTIFFNIDPDRAIFFNFLTDDKRQGNPMIGCPAGN